MRGQGGVVGQQLLLLVVGFTLTSVVGGALGYWFQRRAWAHQHEIELRDEERQREVQRREEEHQRALKTFEEVSRLLDRRLYRMRRLYWAARDMAAGTGDQERLAAARAGYREILAEWNDNLNRNLALIETYFGTPARNVMGGQIYESFAALGRGLEEIVKIVTAAGDGRVEIPRIGHRITRLSRSVNTLNLQMLRRLGEDSIDPAAPEEISPAAPREIAAARATPGARPLLQIGDQNRDVRRLQRALRRAGQNIRIDGRFRQETWTAVCSLQRSRGLDADGIAGPLTWAALPADAPMPLLRLGSQGDPVAGLQRVLTEQAPGRWVVSPQAVTGVFDATTSAAVQAFQRWSGITSDGLVGDQTWAAPVRDSGTSLEAAVGLEHATSDRSQLFSPQDCAVPGTGEISALPALERFLRSAPPGSVQIGSLSARAVTTRRNRQANGARPQPGSGTRQGRYGTRLRGQIRQKDGASTRFAVVSESVQRIYDVHSSQSRRGRFRAPVCPGRLVP
jgi:peptidoglycan hydrolase-like protein with peptidoglycan-binding domain